MSVPEILLECSGEEQSALEALRQWLGPVHAVAIADLSLGYESRLDFASCADDRHGLVELLTSIVREAPALEQAYDGFERLGIIHGSKRRGDTALPEPDFVNPVLRIAEACEVLAPRIQAFLAELLAHVFKLQRAADALRDGSATFNSAGDIVAVPSVVRTRRPARAARSRPNSRPCPKEEPTMHDVPPHDPLSVFAVGFAVPSDLAATLAEIGRNAPRFHFPPVFKEIAENLREWRRFNPITMKQEARCARDMIAAYGPWREALRSMPRMSAIWLPRADVRPLCWRLHFEFCAQPPATEAKQ